MTGGYQGLWIRWKAIEAEIDKMALQEQSECSWEVRDAGPDMVEVKCSQCGFKDYPTPSDYYYWNRNFCPICGNRKEIIENYCERNKITIMFLGQPPKDIYRYGSAEIDYRE